MFVAVGVYHRSHPDFPLAEPLLDRSLVGMLYQVSCQEVRDLDGDPFTRMMASRKEYFAGAALAFA